MTDNSSLTSALQTTSAEPQTTAEPQITPIPLKPIIEAALFAAAGGLTLDTLQGLFVEDDPPPTRSILRAILTELQQDCINRGVELVETAAGFRFQTKSNLTPWVKRLFMERPPRYSRALLETLAIIAYRQPITRQEIENIRGISVSTDLIKKLQDYNWIRILAHRDTPGHPALYGTTRAFLDHFNLKTLNDLPTLAELRNLEDLSQGNLFNPEEEEPDQQNMTATTTLPEPAKATPATAIPATPGSAMNIPDDDDPTLDMFDSNVSTTPRLVEIPPLDQPADDSTLDMFESNVSAKQQLVEITPLADQPTQPTTTVIAVQT